MKTSRFTAFVLLLLASALMSPAFAQSDRGAIKGVVVDPQGSVVSGATVTLTNLATAARVNVTTDNSGNFLFPALVVGRYQLTAEHTGFKKFAQPGVQVEVGRTTTLTVALAPGDVSETVTVTEQALALDTATSETGTTVTRRQILDLPVPLTGSMRNPLNFVILTPGVSGSVPRANPDLRFNISGAPAESSEVYVDGIPISDTNSSGNISTNHPALEAVGEFKISNNGYSAEYGLATAIISFTLRSGTNQFHGHAFEFLQNDALNALDSPTKTVAGFTGTRAVKAPLKQNEYGFTLGGPVWLPKKVFGPFGYDGHNRLFFFTSYAGFKFRPSANNFALTTFPNRFRQGDFSQQLGAQLTVPNPLNPAQQLPIFDPAGRPILAGAIYDPTRSRTVTGPDGKSYQIRDPFAGNLIPAGYAGLSPASRRILQDFPQAASDALFNNFFRQTSSKTDQERFVAKLDYNLSSRQTLSGSYSRGDNVTADTGTLNLLSAGQNATPSLQIRLAHNFTISPRLVNSFLFGFLRDRFTTGPVVPTPPLESLGLRGITLPPFAAYPGIGIRNQNGIGGGGGGVSVVTQNRFITSDTVAYALGNHSFKFGGELRRLQRNQVSNNAGGFQFEPTQTALNGVGFVNTAQGPVAVSIPGGGTGSSAASFLFGAVDFSRFDIVIGQDDQSRIARRVEAAQQAQRAGDFATAIREYTILSRLMSEVAEVHSNLGVAYYFHKQRREALTAFERAIQLNPDLTSALIFSGIANYELSRPAQAIKLLERAARLSPADPLAQTWLAHSYAAQARFREAVDRFLIASERAPNDVDVWYGLGQAYLELGRQEVERLTEVAPNGARTLQLAGDLWRLRGEVDKALALYQEALKRRPDLTELRQIAGQLLSQQGKPPPAEVASPQASQPAQPPSAEDERYLAATELRERPLSPDAGLSRAGRRGGGRTSPREI